MVGFTGYGQVSTGAQEIYDLLPVREVVPAELWTGCYTPRELRLLCDATGLVVDRITSVEPGAYGDDPPTVDTAEFLLIAHTP